MTAHALKYVLVCVFWKLKLNNRLQIPILTLCRRATANEWSLFAKLEFKDSNYITHTLLADAKNSISSKKRGGCWSCGLEVLVSRVPVHSQSLISYFDCRYFQEAIVSFCHDMINMIEDFRQNSEKTNFTQLWYCLQNNEKLTMKIRMTHESSPNDTLHSDVPIITR